MRWGYVCGWGHKVLGCLWASWGDTQMRSPQRLIGRPLDGVHNAISMTCSAPWLLFFQVLITLQLWFDPQLTAHCSGWGERGMGIFGSLLHSWRSWVLTLESDLLLQEKLLHWEGLSCTGLCCLGGGVMWVRSKSFSCSIWGVRSQSCCYSVLELSP